MNQYPFPTLIDLTEYLEREFRMQYRETAESVQRPLADRVEQGVAMPGLKVVRHHQERGGWVTVFETDAVESKFRAGDYVYCHPQNERLDLQSGMLGLQKQSQKKIISISADRKTVVLPERFTGDRTWCLDELPKERFPLTTYPCLMAGVIDAENDAGRKVQRWLSADVKPFSSGTSRLGPETLTTAQRRSLERALADEFAIIQGPPGTGKTYLIAEIIQQQLSLDPNTRILVSCFSHAAIDKVLHAVHDQNPEIPLFRIGRRDEDPKLPPRVQDAGKKLTDGVVPGVWGMTPFAAAGPWTTPLFAAYRQANNQRDVECTIEDRAEMARAAWASRDLPSVDSHFDVVIIDEASQMTLPNALMVMPHGTRCILVGDQKQLPPVSQLQSPFAPSIFDHAIDSFEEERSVMLDITHRMNHEVCLSPSRLFYGGELKPREDIVERRFEYPSPLNLNCDRPEWLRRALDPEEPVLFLSIDHDTGQESSDKEAQCVAEIVAEMLATEMSHKENLAIVCAHRKQNALVRRLTKQAVTKDFPERKLDVDGLVSDTVERIQGQERDVIIVSLAGSEPSHLSLQWNFSHCPRRFNVSITRPKSKLLVVGSPNFFHFTPAVGHGESLEQLTGPAALKRWYLDRLDREQIVVVNHPF